MTTLGRLARDVSTLLTEVSEMRGRPVWTAGAWDEVARAATADPDGCVTAHLLKRARYAVSCAALVLATAPGLHTRPDMAWVLADARRAIERAETALRIGLGLH